MKSAPPAGRRVLQAAVGGTAVFATTAVVAAVTASADVAALGVALAMFALGSAAFVAAYAAAVARSRTDDIALAALFFLSGSASRRVRVVLLGSLGAQVLVAFATAAARPNSSLAFGILAPVYGLGLAALWAARHGRFPPRPAPAGRRRGTPPPSPVQSTGP